MFFSNSFGVRAVILAGGSGSRLWPLSTASRPKQFLSLFGNKTLFRNTLERLSYIPVDSLTTVCNEDHKFLITDQIRECGMTGTVILEPFSRNTAPAIALAALHQKKEDPLLLVLPADHVITDHLAFERAVGDAVSLAEQGYLVAFGVMPISPHTGYGYIEVGKKIGSGFSISSFREKPDLKTAKSYLDGRGHYWNSGIFLFRASQYLGELKAFHPEIYEACVNAIGDTLSSGDFARPDPTAFERCPDLSVDYAVMEKTKDAVVVPLDAGWDDIGSWTSIWSLSDKDQSGNAIIGNGIAHSSHNNYLRSDERLVATVGLNDSIVIATDKAVLVAHKDRVQDINALVGHLNPQSLVALDTKPGPTDEDQTTDQIEANNLYRIKRKTLGPGEKTNVYVLNSVGEHWVIVAGLAKISDGEKIVSLASNECIYLSPGIAYELESLDSVALQMIGMVLTDRKKLQS